MTGAAITNGGALAGVRVLDVSAAVAGPFTTSQLADQGADVISVEPVDRPDVLRLTGPVVGDVSGAWVAMNRSKRAIALDLRSPRGRELALLLADRADVFVQNWRPGVAERLGLGYAELAARNPRLVYVSVSGFGPDGPYADQPVYDPIIQATAGVVAGQGGDFVKNVFADKITAMTAANAALSALVARAATGLGQHVQVNMLDATMAFLWLDMFWNHTIAAAPHAPTYTEWYEPFTTADGQLALAWPTDDRFRRACEGLGRPELALDPRFATRAERVLNAQALLEECRPTFAALRTADALAVLRAADVPCAPVQDLDQVLADPQVAHNQLIETYEHPSAGPVRALRPPARLSATPPPRQRPAPGFGQHTDEVLGELGLSAGEIAALRAERIVA
ncbi:MAG: CaiB/BaiF CoA transferase family protein [Acidimicrobiales bacterium]